jgi:hypothetical protein
MVEIVVGRGEAKVFAVERPPDIWLGLEFHNLRPWDIIYDVKASCSPPASHYLPGKTNWGCGVPDEPAWRESKSAD